MPGVLCGTLRQLYLKRLLTLRLNGLLRRRLLSLRVYGCVRCTMCNDSYDLQVPRSFLGTYMHRLEADYMSPPPYMCSALFFCLRLHARPTRFFPTPSIKHQASLIYFFCERKSKKCRGAAEPVGRGKICPVARSHCKLLTFSCCALSALSENIKSLQQKQQHKKTGDSKRKVEGCW